MKLLTVNNQNILAVESSTCAAGSLTKSTVTTDCPELFTKGKLAGELHLEVDKTTDQCSYRREEFQLH